MDALQDSNPLAVAGQHTVSTTPIESLHPTGYAETE